MRSLGRMSGAGQIAMLAVPAQGRIVGAGVALPRLLAVSDRERVRVVLARIAEQGFGGSMRLCEPLYPGAWIGPARTWVTVTPYVRDGYADRTPSDQRRLVRRSLRYVLAAEHGDVTDAIGELVQEIEIGVDSFAADVPCARVWPSTAGTAPEHLRIVFAEPVLGPLIVGRDRRLGLGLMRTAD